MKALFGSGFTILATAKIGLAAIRATGYIIPFDNFLQELPGMQAFSLTLSVLIAVPVMRNEPMACLIRIWERFGGIIYPSRYI